MKLTWYEWLWSALPLLLIPYGGVLGGLFGVLAFALNIRQFRSHPSRTYNFMVTALISISAVIIYFFLWFIIVGVMSGL